MSWDISLKEKQSADVEVIEVGNYTYNVSKMYIEAIGKTLGEFHEMQSLDAVETLRSGVVEMISNPDKYRAMNPVNGYGNYEGALKYLQTFLHECEKNPNSIIEVY